MSNLTPHEQANAVALAPRWWRDCWNLDHEVDLVLIENRLKFICKQCRSEEAAVVTRERLSR